MEWTRWAQWWLLLMAALGGGAVLCLLPFKGSLRMKGTALAWVCGGVLSLVSLAGAGLTAQGLGDFNDAVLLALVLLFYPYYMAVKAPVTRKIFMYLTVCCFSACVGAVCRCIHTLVFAPLWEGATSQELLVQGAFVLSAFLVLVLALQSYLTPMLLYFKDETVWRVLWMVPAAFYVILVFHTNILTQGTSGLLIYAMVTVEVIMGAVVVYYLLFLLTLRNIQVSDLSRDIAQTQRQYALIKEQYHLMMRAIDETRAARHDLRHHVTALAGLAQQGEMARITAYLEQLQGQMDLASQGAALCENPAVNSVAQHYLGRARELGARIEAALKIPEDVPYEDRELCVLVGNLLENAVEAVAGIPQGQRFIRCHAVRQGEMLSLTVENSFGGELSQKEGKLVSRKRGNQPGVGLQSVKAIVDKYHGELRLNHENGVFEAFVLLLPR